MVANLRVCRRLVIQVLLLPHPKISGNGFSESPNSHPILIHLPLHHNHLAVLLASLTVAINIP